MDRLGCPETRDPKVIIRKAPDVLRTLSQTEMHSLLTVVLLLPFGNQGKAPFTPGAGGGTVER